MRAESSMKLNLLLVAEESFKEEVKKTRASKRLLHSSQRLLAYLKEVGRSHNASLIIATERDIIQGDLDRYANSKHMIASLNAALDEIAAIERQTAMLEDPVQYGFVNQLYSLAKNREQGLPLDEARQAFKSHYARLNNLDKSRLDEVDKQMIEARKAALRNARRLYVQRQPQTLGVASGPGEVPTE